MDTPPTVSVRIARKVAITTYENVDVAIALAGIPAGATRQQIEDAMQTAELTFDVLQLGMAEVIRETLKNSSKGLLA